MVISGEGIWKSNRELYPIKNSKAKVFALKLHFNYFSYFKEGGPKKLKKTHWKLDKYRMLSNNQKPEVIANHYIINNVLEFDIEFFFNKISFD